MLAAVTSALSTVIGWIGTVITALVTEASETVAAGALNPLLPLFAIGIAISALLLGIKIIKSVVFIFWIYSGEKACMIIF